MTTNHCSCGDIALSGRVVTDVGMKPKSPSIERCINSEFRQRSNTSPSDLVERATRSRPRARLARDPVQPSCGSLTRQHASEERSEEEDSITPMMRPRSNTCPEKRALQLVRRRIRNRPPTPPPGDISPVSGSPRERASSLSRSRERLLGPMIAEVPEGTDQKDFDTAANGQLLPPTFQSGRLDPDKVCRELHRLKLAENNNLADPGGNSVRINVTNSDGVKDNPRFGESGETLTVSPCRSNRSAHAKARLSLP